MAFARASACRRASCSVMRRRVPLRCQVGLSTGSLRARSVERSRELIPASPIWATHLRHDPGHRGVPRADKPCRSNAHFVPEGRAYSRLGSADSPFPIRLRFLHRLRMNFRVCAKCGRDIILGVCVCLGLYGPAGVGPQLPSHSAVDTIQGDGVASSRGNGGPQLPPARTVSAMLASGTGPTSPFFAIADENIGVVRLAVWPHSKGEREVEGSRLGPTGPTGPVAEPTPWRIFGPNGPAAPRG